MGAPSYSDLLERFPRLTAPADAVEQDLLDVMLSEAWDDHDEQTWGDARARGALLQGAHEWYIHKLPAQAPAGPVKSKSAGGWSKSFGGSDSPSTEAYWTLSPYGRQHLELERQHRGCEWFDGPEW